MTLTNYWWLLLWLVLVGGSCALFFPRQTMNVCGKIEYRWRAFPVIATVIPYAGWAGNRSHFGDTETYRGTFQDAPASIAKISSYLDDHTKDKGFSVLMIAMKSIIGNNDKLFFLLIAFFQVFCVAYFFRKYSTDFLFCMFMFVMSTDYLSWMHNGIRQFIAVGIVLLAFGLVLRKKYVPAILIILLAATIHMSVLLMIPIIFVVQGKAWNKRTLLALLAVVLAVLFINQFTSILDNALSDTQYSDLITNEIWTADNGANILRVLFYSVPAMLSLAGKRYVDEANDPVINVCINCAAVTSLLYILASVSSGIYIGRLPIYTTLYPYCQVGTKKFFKTSPALV